METGVNPSNVYTIRGKSLKITIRLHGLIPSETGDLMIPWEM